MYTFMHVIGLIGFFIMLIAFYFEPTTVTFLSTLSVFFIALYLRMAENLARNRTTTYIRKNLYK